MTRVSSCFEPIFLRFTEANVLIGRSYTGNLAQWLGPLVALAKHHPEADEDHMVDLNIQEQVRNVQIALERIGYANRVQVHGWVYALRTGLIHDLATPRESN